MLTVLLKLLRQKDIGQFIRFCLVGGLTALLYGGATFFFLEIVQADYKIAISMAYVVGVSFHFFCSRNVTFAATDAHLGGQLARYLVLLLVNYGLTLGVAMASVDLLGLSPYLASALSLFIPMLVTFFVLKGWVFATADSATTSKDIREEAS